MVNGSTYLATQNNSFPFWLDAGSTLSTNPPMNFISVVEYNENEVGDDKNLGYSKVLSITESSVVPDGKVWKVVSALQYHYEGCTDETMFNYDPQANVDDGSCVEIVYGCINPDYLTFNSNANVDDGTCSNEILGCLNPSACNYNSFANSTSNCEWPDEGFDCDGNLNVQIGDEAFGGIVFYIDELSNYGLVAAEQDADIDNIYLWEWGCYQEGFPLANSPSLGSGSHNTYVITSNCNERPIAASVADEYLTDQYTDWYLPSIHELDKMYDVLWEPDNSFTNFSNGWYWSSTEYSDDLAWYFNFNNGTSNQANKDVNNRVRVIRTFNF